MNKSEFAKFIPDFKEIQESPLIIEGSEVAYSSSVILSSGLCLGTGFSTDVSVARQIALAEAIERRLFYKLLTSPSRTRLLLDLFPTSCGFAVGFDDSKTVDRAIAEAVERWVRSKWIDDGLSLHCVHVHEISFGHLEEFYISQFDEVRVYSHKCEVSVNSCKLPVYSDIVVGFTDHGAFVGSKSTVGDTPRLLSALVEAWRHMHLSKLPAEVSREIDIVRYFAENKHEAIKQIDHATKLDWPAPTIRICEKIEVPIEGVYAYRALCNDFVGWHGNNIKRFVY